MNHQVTQRISQRVADYFVVVGAGDTLRVAVEHDSPSKKTTIESESKSGLGLGLGLQLQHSYQADIIDRYPLEDRTDFALPDGLQLFCLPNGLQITGPHPPTFHSFVHTSEHGCHILGCCLTIYEPLTAQQIASINGSNDENDNDTGNNAENNGENNGFKINNNINNNENNDSNEGRNNGINSNTNNNTNNITNNNTNKIKNDIKNHDKRYNNLFSPLCLCLISHWPFVSSFKSFLCGLYRISLSRSKIPLERIICNFIDEVPSPPAGRVDITYYLGEEDQLKIISFRCPPANQPNVWSSMPLFPLFECLSPENVLSLFALILTERQLIFVSSQYSLLTSCAEAVTSLIYPLSWTHAYIPILPKQLLGKSYYYYYIIAE